MTVKHLEDTGVGRTVNALRKYDSTVGTAAKALVTKWKTMVANECVDSKDEDDVCMSDVPVSYSDNPKSPTPPLKSEEIEENIISDELESKHMYKDRQDKNEMSMEHGTKQPKSENMEDKHKKHKKSRHSSKHNSQDETRSKDSKSKSSFKKDEAHDSKEHSKINDLEKSRDKATGAENSNKKRSLDSLSSLKKEIKKSKMLDSKIDDGVSHIEKDYSSKPFEIKIKIENVDEKPVKQEKSLQEESKSNSSKTKYQDSSSKSKDNTEKQKYKKEEHANHGKIDTRKRGHHSNKEIADSKVSHSKDQVKSKDKDKKSKHKDKSEHGKKKRLEREMISNDGIDCNSG